jgi:hypothetical protein
MYRDTTNVEPEMYDYTSNNWSHWNNDEKLNPLNAELNLICHLLALLGAQPILHVSRIRFTEKFVSRTRKTFVRFTTKDSYTWNITHNTESTAV